MKCANTVPYRGAVTSAKRQQLLGQQSMVLWFTGLSGSGKSTIAHAVEERLHEMGRRKERSRITPGFPLRTRPRKTRTWCWPVINALWQNVSQRPLISFMKTYLMEVNCG